VLVDDVAAVERVASEMVEDAHNNGVKYLEVGLDPSKFVTEGGGLEHREVVQAALRGMKALAGKGTKAGLLLQVERGNTAGATGLLDLCDSLKASGVVGLELTCGDPALTPSLTAEGGSMEELLFSTEDMELMEEAKRRNIHRSVQAGEFGPAEMVFQALEKLSADRIVHGYTMVTDPSLYHDCIKNKIHFAIQPSMSVLNG